MTGIDATSAPTLSASSAARARTRTGFPWSPARSTPRPTSTDSTIATSVSSGPRAGTPNCGTGSSASQPPVSTSAACTSTYPLGDPPRGPDGLRRAPRRCQPWSGHLVEEPVAPAVTQEVEALAERQVAALLTSAYPVAQQRGAAPGGQTGGRAQLLGVLLRRGQRLVPALGDQLEEIGLEALHQVGAGLPVEVVEQRTHPVDVLDDPAVQLLGVHRTVSPCSVWTRTRSTAWAKCAQSPRCRLSSARPWGVMP